MKQKDTNNVYKLIDKLTGKEVPTNPKQFRDLVARWGVDADTVKNNYVSRETRKQLRESKLTASQIVTAYALDARVVAKLKNLAPEPVVEAPVTEDENISVEAPSGSTIDVVVSDAAEAPVTDDPNTISVVVRV
jgi:hypothetical protein